MRRFNTAITRASLAIGMIARGLPIAAHAQRYQVKDAQSTVASRQDPRAAARLAQQLEMRGSGRVSEIERLPVPNRRSSRIRLNAERTDLHQDLGIIGLGYTDRASGVAC